ncbi:MAG: nucleotide sugar dehydrogenase [Alphaproteobacteria bacterium]|nr:nucleotide sugar dehydrogenase [Alphaproteobacteria bacterium]
MAKPAELPADISGLRPAVIGIGYVGLPVAVAFGHARPTIAFDVNPKRVADLTAGHDETREVEPDELAAASQLTFASNPDDLATANFFIVTVPTPIDAFKRPDLSYLERASETVGKVLKRGDIVVYESTVFPGATEEHCVPVLEKVSGLKFNEDFYCGYSPERINPGDKKHRLADIQKVTSGSTPQAADLIDALYSSIITAGTFKASSIRVAEAAKVIENTQRDVNIALVNELAVLFSRLGIDTEEVLKAAGTKWNFLPFRPGLVGGHCIGVDPYYLTHKAQEVGHHSEMILAGRRINDGIGDHAGRLVLDAMISKGTAPASSRVLMLGVTFKENCPDIRNTLVARTISYLQARGVTVDVHDPWVDAEEARKELGLDLVETPEKGAYDAAVLAVAHDAFEKMGAKGVKEFLKPTGILADLKWAFDATDTDTRL